MTTTAQVPVAVGVKLVFPPPQPMLYALRRTVTAPDGTMSYEYFKGFFGATLSVVWSKVTVDNPNQISLYASQQEADEVRAVLIRKEASATVIPLCLKD